VTQVLRNVLDHGMTIDAAIDAPRIHHGFVPDLVRYEAKRPPPRAILDALRKLGHRFSDKRIPSAMNDLLATAWRGAGRPARWWSRRCCGEAGWARCEGCGCWGFCRSLAAAGVARAGLPERRGGQEIESTDVDALAKADESERFTPTRRSAVAGARGRSDARTRCDDDYAGHGRSTAEPARPPEPTSAPKPSPCDVACRALDSMRRSATRICELTGDADERCNGARTRVTRAAQQVERAGCACS
jgi:hypothetical protein